MKNKDNSNREETPQPDPEFIAQQLRMPSGEFAAEIAEVMNRVNHPLMVIYFWDKPEKHLREVYRVLRTGGVFYTGFRPRKSMLLFPFVKHGFILYDVEEWASVLENTGFTVTEIVRKTDPEIENNGRTIRLESVCIVAEKQA